MTVDFNQPQVAAAIIGGGVVAVVSLIVAVLNQLSLRSMHKKKLGAEQALAEIGKSPAEQRRYSYCIWSATGSHTAVPVVRGGALSGQDVTAADDHCKMRACDG